MNEAKATLLRWESHHKSVTQSYYCYYINQEMVDVTLLLKDAEIKAHRIILCAGSRYIENALSTHEQGQCKVFENTPKEIMSYLIEYLYKGQVAVPNRVLRKVVDAAEIYKVRGITMVPEEFSSCQSWIGSEQIPPQDKDQTTEYVSLPSSSNGGRKTRLISNTSVVKSPVKINPLAIRKTHSNEMKNRHAVLHSGKNLSRHGSAPKRTSPDHLYDSDETHIEEIQKPQVSVQPLNPTKRQVSTEVEIVDKEDDPIVIQDTVNRTVLSPDLCEVVSSSNEQQIRVRNRLELFESTDEEQDEPVTKKPKSIVTPFRRKRILTKLNDETENEGDEASAVSDKKIKKYEQLLLKSRKFAEISQFCVRCFKFYNNMEMHIQNHKKMPKIQHECEQCGKLFCHVAFSAKNNHNCVRKKSIGSS